MYVECVLNDVECGRDPAGRAFREEVVAVAGIGEEEVVPQLCQSTRCLYCSSTGAVIQLHRVVH